MASLYFKLLFIIDLLNSYFQQRLQLVEVFMISDQIIWQKQVLLVFFSDPLLASLTTGAHNDSQLIIIVIV